MYFIFIENIDSNIKFVNMKKFMKRYKQSRKSNIEDKLSDMNWYVVVVLQWCILKKLLK